MNNKSVYHELCASALYFLSHRQEMNRMHQKHACRIRHQTTVLYDTDLVRTQQFLSV